MAQQIIIPQFGTSVDKVTVLSWKVREGEAVKKGDLLCEVETDKSAMEIESFYNGTLIKVLAGEGDEVSIGEVIAYLGEPGEKVSEEETVSSSTRPSAGRTVDKSNGGIKAMPKVRKLAGELGVDLHDIKPTGASGEITEQDVRVRHGGTAGTGAVIELSKNQKAVAARIKQSYSEIIPINLSATINVRSIERARTKIAEDTGGIKPSFDAFFAAAAVNAMGTFPRFQYYYDHDRLIHAGGPNVGVAVSTDEELFIPVVKGASGKGISVEQADTVIRGYKRKAREGSFRREDFEGGVFLLSNLGMYPVDSFTLIIPPRYSAALSIGRSRIVRDGLLRDSSTTIDDHVVTVLLSVDHRFINGRAAAVFLEELKTLLES